MPTTPAAATPAPPLPAPAPRFPQARTAALPGPDPGRSPPSSPPAVPVRTRPCHTRPLSRAAGCGWARTRHRHTRSPSAPTTPALHASTASKICMPPASPSLDLRSRPASPAAVAAVGDGWWVHDGLTLNFENEKHLAENGRLLQLQIADFHMEYREVVLQLQKGEVASFWMEAVASSL
ncbi:vegetative cell wall protein gp1-like [Panicum virgatum]|uniref:vegetative cell wall protein gp1-like n=1 Tax=Panicum virgatum TaxID=38727 RepID=UPI0019D51EEC|nr:vegetative cell wall protein gp1-like [Panicum virgatum]